MSLHEIMDSSGHAAIEFDKTNEAQRREAMERFERLVEGQKMLAVTRRAGEREYTVAKTFDDTLDETLFRPHLGGG